MRRRLPTCPPRIRGGETTMLDRGRQRRGLGPWPSEGCLHARSCTLRCQRTARSAASRAHRTAPRTPAAAAEPSSGVSLEESNRSSPARSIRTPCSRMRPGGADGTPPTLAAEPISLMLTDADGVVLNRMCDERTLLRQLDDVHLAPGFSYSERRRGTNGWGWRSPTGPGHAGTSRGALRAQPLCLHLRRRTCARPIHRTPRGSINLTTWSRASSDLLVALAQSAAGNTAALMARSLGRQPRPTGHGAVFRVESFGSSPAAARSSRCLRRGRAAVAAAAGRRSRRRGGRRAGLGTSDVGGAGCCRNLGNDAHRGRSSLIARCRGVAVVVRLRVAEAVHDVGRGRRRRPPGMGRRTGAPHRRARHRPHHRDPGRGDCRTVRRHPCTAGATRRRHRRRAGAATAPRTCCRSPARRTRPWPRRRAQQGRRARAARLRLARQRRAAGARGQGCGAADFIDVHHLPPEVLVDLSHRLTRLQTLSATRSCAPGPAGDHDSGRRRPARHEPATLYRRVAQYGVHVPRAKADRKSSVMPSAVRSAGRRRAHRRVLPRRCRDGRRVNCATADRQATKTSCDVSLTTVTASSQTPDHNTGGRMHRRRIELTAGSRPGGRSARSPTQSLGWGPDDPGAEDGTRWFLPLHGADLWLRSAGVLYLASVPRARPAVVTSRWSPAGAPPIRGAAGRAAAREWDERALMIEIAPWLPHGPVAYVAVRAAARRAGFRWFAEIDGRPDPDELAGPPGSCFAGWTARATGQYCCSPPRWRHPGRVAATGRAGRFSGAVLLHGALSLDPLPPRAAPAQDARVARLRRRRPTYPQPLLAATRDWLRRWSGAPILLEQAPGAGSPDRWSTRPGAGSLPGWTTCTSTARARYPTVQSRTGRASAGFRNGPASRPIRPLAFLSCRSRPARTRASGTGSSASVPPRRGDRPARHPLPAAPRRRGPPAAFLHGSEFAHLHSDGSLHLCLPPDLAYDALVKGWAPTRWPASG